MEHNQANHVEMLRVSGKEKIIESAIALLKEKKPALNLDYNDYEITVWTNSTKVLVKFRSLFRVFPLEGSVTGLRSDEFSVDLITKEITPVDLYQITEYEDKIIHFIKENTNLPYPVKRNYRYEIYDRGGDYDIYIRMNGSFTNYRINKVTGEQSGYNELNANPALMPLIDTDETDLLEEL